MHVPIQHEQQSINYNIKWLQSSTTVSITHKKADLDADPVGFITALVIIVIYPVPLQGFDPVCYLYITAGLLVTY